MLYVSAIVSFLTQIDGTKSLRSRLIGYLPQMLRVLPSQEALTLAQAIIHRSEGNRTHTVLPFQACVRMKNNAESAIAQELVERDIDSNVLLSLP
jgi:hypothetical protein